MTEHKIFIRLLLTKAIVIYSKTFKIRTKHRVGFDEKKAISNKTVITSC